MVIKYLWQKYVMEVGVLHLTNFILNISEPNAYLTY